MDERKYYLDNIRWITVVLVILYHIVYIFNCSGVIKNMDVQGIPILDTFCIYLYPWFMCLLFCVAGISSRYSLNKRTNKEFIKDRAKRLLVPSIVGMFAYGWISGLISIQYVDFFAGAGDQIPIPTKYFIYCLMGIGPLWFCHVLLVASILLVVIRKIDKKDKVSELGKKVTPMILVPMVFVVWGSSFILNAPLITVYRFGIYLLMFFLGYYVFSNETLLEKMEKFAVPMIVSTAIIGVLYVIKYYGVNYTEDSVLQSLLTNLYLWLAVISILVFGKKYLNFKNPFSRYMTKNNFSYYVLHYMVVVSLSYFVVTYLHLPFILNYVVIIIGTMIILPVLIEIVKRIPIFNQLILGTKNK